MNLFPLENPILIFSLILFVILGTPYAFKKLKVPHIVGLIIAGSLIGPKGLGFMESDTHIKLFSTLGLLYIMFIASLEIDIADFKKNSYKSGIFGMFTFLIPLILGYLSCYYILGFSILPSILIASFFSSRTLLTYPIITKYNITKNRAVNIAVGGTVITDTLALLVLAIVVGITRGGISSEFWVNMFLRLVAFTFVVIYIFPRLARQFLKAESDHIAQYLFILGMLFLAGFLAELANVEAIIGAFLIGLALNPLIPKTSPLKNRIDFIGNAIFIPIFLISVGMIIDFKVFFTTLPTIWIAITMIIVATCSKYIAALFAQLSFGYSKNERYIIFGLSNSQAAATLAAVMVGYNVGLIESSVLNGTILMILVTCTIASFATEKGASVQAIADLNDDNLPQENMPERILIPLSHPDTVEELVNLGLIIKNNQLKDNMYALNIITDQDHKSDNEKKSNDLLSKAAKIVAATDQVLQEIIRYDINLINGICNIVKERKISDMIIGLHKKTSIIDSFFGKFTTELLVNCVANIYIYRSIQPIHTLTRLIIVIPENAEKESCFDDFMKKVMNISVNAGVKLVVFSSEKINNIFVDYKKQYSFDAELVDFTDWEDFLIVSSKLDQNSGLLIFMNRPCNTNKNDIMNKIPKYLNKYFAKHNYILYFPTRAI